MGRNAGWLTAAAALAKSDDCEGVDMIMSLIHICLQQEAGGQTVQRADSPQREPLPQVQRQH